MEQLIIEHNYNGDWKRKYKHIDYRRYKSLSIHPSLRSKSKLIGVTVDNREKWRKKRDSIMRSADYEIILKGGE